MAINLKNNVYWVGKTDTNIKKFHGEEYSTHHGTSYNSYLIKEEKTVLIDTVWEPYRKDFVKNLKKEVKLEDINYVVANHAELDHSGALGELMKLIPNTPVYCTKAGINSLKGHFHADWNFQPIKTGDKLDLGNSKELIFIEAPMLHWPDSMFCYLTGDAILFSNDAFGQHYATKNFFNDQADQDILFSECIKYYANILTPFSLLVKKKIKQFQNLNLPLEMICPGHGVIWKNNPVQIVEKYLAWSNDYQENEVTIIYDTMYKSTKKMAEQIKTGMEFKLKNSKINIFNVAKDDTNDIITSIFRSKAVIIGSATINNTILSPLAGILEMIKGLKMKNKKFAAFGSYGWSGEGINIIEEKMIASGFEKIFDGLKILWRPNDEQKKQCVEYGKNIAQNIQ